MQATSVWQVYAGAASAVIWLTAVVIFISTIDDLFFDACYWFSEIRARLRGQSERTVDAAALRAMEERYLAVMVPAWKEYDVIAKMIDHTLRTLEYEHYVIFVGTYHNDPETTAEVERMVRRHPGRVTRATVLNDGPTCKADCLNWIVAAIGRYETTHHLRFDGVVMHDCEDVIHPIELKYFNYALNESDLIQLPVLSLPRKWNEFVAGTYLDDFSETHQKDMPTRQRLTGIVPGAGVASCYSRRAIDAAAAASDGKPFNTGSLTEDYDFSFRLKALGMKQSFAHFPIDDDRKGEGRGCAVRNLLATREFFPSTLRTAYRQRARWILGIAFHGWQQIRWSGSFMQRYMLARDRKGMITSLFSVFAYIVLAQYLALAGLRAAGLAPPEVELRALSSAWLAPLLSINAVLLGARLAQRYYFVARLNGPLQGLLSLPRIFVNNVINFLAVCRAWRIFIGHLATGKPIAWDKTNHTYLSTEARGKTRCKLGEILVGWGVLTEAQLEATLTRQAGCGRRLGALLVESGVVSAESVADALAEQAELPRVSLANVAVGHFSKSLAFELQKTYRVVPFSTSDDGTLNVAVGSPLSGDEREIVKRGARSNVAYFVASDEEVDAELERHAHFFEHGTAAEAALRRVAPEGRPGERL
ncbi:glycosyl transferase family protein [Trinickia caryophylli]|uniref:Adsorption protein B n=1 Tax=Trinickia caryophylli TaxID=28094 RepID=A0A1X7CX85_TRICW|nr:glycosyl transferase family protein [Trinickia caryophylli]PMS13451.1 phage receptor protein [Trinickia caryophylli]TRX13690.1 glycosyl transferase family protein [Trinickia caryophylli]WQE15274.1 glycosyl transferase family protein [Trinickia caryophylli]SMF04690.1 adsorption protein B [Trinickia caryophylli]GLU30974.1 bacteriophage N4 adsorption protein B [Trinickia caryophylli]